MKIGWGGSWSADFIGLQDRLRFLFWFTKPQRTVASNTGFGIEGKAGSNKYSVALKFETYSRSENDVGFYFNLSFNVTADVSDKLNLIKGTASAGSTLLDFMPKLDVKGYGYVNLKSSEPTVGMRNETYGTASLSYGALRLEGDTKGVYKLGAGIGTEGVLQGKAGVVNKTTIFDGKTSTINLQGSGN